MPATHNHQNSREFPVLIKQGIELFKILYSILTDERRCLEENRFKDLKAISVKKEACLSKISRHEHHIQQLCEQYDIEYNAEAVDQLLLISGDSEHHHVENIQDYKTRLSQCNDLNNINGRIIHRSRLNAASLLELLKGAAKQEQTYSVKGKKNTEGLHRSIAKA
ncbi:MAG: flagellar protein FlgN [Gammaproteobacteria bacterium]|nr:flagellar protein FlgN [Gammaproteobacteria bacterium]